MRLLIARSTARRAGPTTSPGRSHPAQAHLLEQAHDVLVRGAGDRGQDLTWPAEHGSTPNWFGGDWRGRGNTRAN